jgi:hypothetical protein
VCTLMGPRCALTQTVWHSNVGAKPTAAAPRAPLWHSSMNVKLTAARPQASTLLHAPVEAKSTATEVHSTSRHSLVNVAPNTPSVPLIATLWHSRVNVKPTAATALTALSASGHKRPASALSEWGRPLVEVACTQADLPSRPEVRSHQAHAGCNKGSACGSRAPAIILTICVKGCRKPVQQSPQ